MVAVGGTIASRASEGAEPVSRLLLSLLTCGVAIAATAAPLSPAARAEIDGLLVRLVASGCEFNRNGSWYTAAEAKSHLSQKLKYFEDRGMVQTTEQFIEMAASGSSMSGQPYLVRCGNSAPGAERPVAAVGTQGPALGNTGEKHAVGSTAGAPVDCDAVARVRRTVCHDSGQECLLWSANIQINTSLRPCRSITYWPVPLQASIRDVSRPRSTSRGRAHPPPIDVGTQTSGPFADSLRRIRHARTQRAVRTSLIVMSRSTLAESTADVLQTAESSNRGILFVWSRSRVRRSSSLSDSQRAIAILRHPRPGSNHQDAWRRSDLGHGSDTDAALPPRRLLATAAASSPRSDARSHSHAPVGVSRAR